MYIYKEKKYQNKDKTKTKMLDNHNICTALNDVTSQCLYISNYLSVSSVSVSVTSTIAWLQFSLFC